MEFSQAIRSLDRHRGTHRRVVTLKTHTHVKRNTETERPPNMEDTRTYVHIH